RTHLLRPDVVGVVVAGGEHVGADHHAALHLAAEALGPGELVHVGDVLAGNPEAVFHAVVAGEVRRSLGGRDNVVGRQRVFRVRQRDVADGGAFGGEPGDALLPKLLDLRGHALHAVFARNPDGQPLDAALDRRGEVRHRNLGAGRVLG